MRYETADSKYKYENQNLQDIDIRQKLDFNIQT